MEEPNKYRLRRFRRLFSLIKGKATKLNIVESSINKEEPIVKQSKLNLW